MTIVTPTRRRQHTARGATRRPSRRAPRAPRRLALQRLRSLFFQNSDLAQRYDMTFDRLVAHLWRARRLHPRLLLGSVNCMDDLIHAVACLDNNSLAWSDLPVRHERTMVRRCRDGRDDTETTVIVRRFVAELRRLCINGRDAAAVCPFGSYAGTRPLRNWLTDQLNESLRRRQRAAFMFDSADSPAGDPLRFAPHSSWTA
jgi:hypothetical protein